MKLLSCFVRISTPTLAYQNYGIARQKVNSNWFGVFETSCPTTQNANRNGAIGWEEQQKHRRVWVWVWGKKRMVSRGFEPRIQDSKSWVLTTTLQDPRGCNALHTTLITRSRNNNRLPSSFAQLSICSSQSTQPHTLMSQFESFITFSKTNTIY